MKLKEETISSKRVYKNLFMDIYLDEVLLPNNRMSKRIYIKHDGAAAVLPITKEGLLVLIRQFRYPVNEILYEIPAGKKDDILELGIDCAKRELEEETGLKSDFYEKIVDLYNCVGYSNEMIELFIAKDCLKVKNPRRGDDDEFIEVLFLTQKEVRDLMDQGKITDSKTLVALQHYFLKNR